MAELAMSRGRGCLPPRRCYDSAGAPDSHGGNVPLRNSVTALLLSAYGFVLSYLTDDNHKYSYNFVLIATMIAAGFEIQNPSKPLL